VFHFFVLVLIDLNLGDQASGSTFDPNIRLGPKLVQKVPMIPTMERRCANEVGSIRSKRCVENCETSEQFYWQPQVGVSHDQGI
jgi:hypothetical protein